jgi:branched-chain amino acid transport system ATP-binding protein
MSAALSTRGLDKSFGSLVVAKDIAFSLPQGARHALIGPNGAGKTTLINLMTGMLRPDAGEILLGDEPITSLAPDKRVSRGLVAAAWSARSRSTRCFPISTRSKP